MKRLIAIAISAVLILTGCTSEPEFGEVSSAIQDSQEMQNNSSEVQESSEEPVVSQTVRLERIFEDFDLAFGNCGYMDGEFGPKTFYQAICMQNFPLPGPPADSAEVLDSLPIPQTPRGLQEHLLKLYSLGRTIEPIERSNEFAPGVDVETAQLITFVEDRLLAFWRLLGVESVRGARLWVNQDGWEYWANWAAENGADEEYLNLWEKDSGHFGTHCWVTETSYCVGGSTPKDRQLTTTVLGSNFDGHNLVETAAHEVLHTLQGELQFDDKCWWTEGVAQIFGQVLGYAGRTEQVELLRLRTGAQNYSIEDLSRLYSENTICDLSDEARYSVGAFAVEYILLNWTIREFFELWTTAIDLGWDDAVTTVLGIDSSELDDALAEYVILSAKREVADADYGKPWEKPWVQELISNADKNRAPLNLRLVGDEALSLGEFMVAGLPFDDRGWLETKFNEGGRLPSFGEFKKHEVLVEKLYLSPFGQYQGQPNFAVRVYIPFGYDSASSWIEVEIVDEIMVVSGEAVFEGPLEFSLR